MDVYRIEIFANMCYFKLISLTAESANKKQQDYAINIKNRDNPIVLMSGIIFKVNSFD